jgi:hypothetical protein
MLGKLAGATLLVAGVAVVRAQAGIMLARNPNIQKWDNEMAKAAAPLAFQLVRDEPGLHMGIALKAIGSGVLAGIKETIEFGLKEKNTGV